MLLELHTYYGYSKSILINTKFIEYIIALSPDKPKEFKTGIKLNGKTDELVVRESYNYLFEKLYKERSE